MGEEKEEKLAVDQVTATAEQVEAAAIAKRHGVKKVYKVVVNKEDSDEPEYSAWIRKPGLKEFSMFSTLLADNKSIEASQAVLRTCYLEGDKEVINDEDVFLGALSQIQELMKMRTSSIKKF